MTFKEWADNQSLGDALHVAYTPRFGSVRAAFKVPGFLSTPCAPQVLDKDRSGELSLSEFRHAVLSNGFSNSDEARFEGF